MTEEWRDVVGHPGYKVSSEGRVQSQNRILKPFVVSNDRNRRGAMAVQLGRGSKYKVSHLVLEAFIGPRPQGLIARHLDDDPKNNRVANLRWGSYSENAYDAVRNGRHGGAARTHCKDGHPLVQVSATRRGCRVCINKRTKDYKRRVREGLPIGKPGRPKKVG